MAWIQSLFQKLPYAMGVPTKKERKEGRKESRKERREGGRKEGKKGGKKKKEMPDQGESSPSTNFLSIMDVMTL